MSLNRKLLSGVSVVLKPHRCQHYTVLSGDTGSKIQVPFAFGFQLGTLKTIFLMDVCALAPKWVQVMVLNFLGQLRPSVSKRDEFNRNQIIVILNSEKQITNRIRSNCRSDGEIGVFLFAIANLPESKESESCLTRSNYLPRFLLIYTLYSSWSVFTFSFLSVSLKTFKFLCMESGPACWGFLCVSQVVRKWVTLGGE